jgi:hypothetical protein
MLATRGFIAAMLLCIGSSASAQGLNDFGGAGLAGLIGPRIYSTKACWGGGANDCSMTATSTGYPNPADYTTFATLTLPPGDYVVSGKLSYWVKTPTYVAPWGNLTWGNLECFIGLPDKSDGDWSSAGIKGDQYVVSMMAPLKLTARSTTLHIGCKLWGGYVPESGGDALPAEVSVWDVRLMAERVSAVVAQ